MVFPFEHLGVYSGISCAIAVCAQIGTIEIGEHRSQPAGFSANATANRDRALATCVGTSFDGCSVGWLPL